MLFVIDTGGSYRGARVATEFLGHSFVNCVLKEIGKSLEIYYVGNSISDKYITDSIEVAGERDFSISMISKSGTMTEPAIACGVSGCLLGVNPFTRQERGAARKTCSYCLASRDTKWSQKDC